MKRPLKVMGVFCLVFLVTLGGVGGCSIAFVRQRVAEIHRLDLIAFDRIRDRVNQRELQTEIVKDQYGIAYSIAIDRYAGYE